MTVDEAIKAIPPGWRLRLTNWEDPTESGWGAQLFHKDGRQVVGDEPTPEGAIMAAIAQIMAQP